MIIFVDNLSYFENICGHNSFLSDINGAEIFEDGNVNTEGKWQIEDLKNKLAKTYTKKDFQFC